jgi:hypothetical protein
MRYKVFGRHTGCGPKLDRWPTHPGGGHPGLRSDDGNKTSALAGQAILHLRGLLSECESWISIVFALSIQHPDIV